jgi:hypothetical protein
MENAVHTRSLKRATELLGGAEALATYLNRSPTLVCRWLDGSLPVPDSVFLKVVDLLLDRGQSEHLTRGSSPISERDFGSGAKGDST